MEEDGACLFRAISYQLYGDQEMHDLIRQRTMDYIFQNREYFAQFITEGEFEAFGFLTGPTWKYPNE